MSTAFIDTAIAKQELEKAVARLVGGTRDTDAGSRCVHDDVVLGLNVRERSARRVGRAPTGAATTAATTTGDGRRVDARAAASPADTA